MINLLANNSGFKEFSVLLTVLIIFAGAIALISLGAAIARWVVFFRYHNLNRENTEAGLTARDAARALLDANNMQNIKVEKIGFFKGLFFGNHYSVKHKTVFLKKNIIDKQSITAVGTALQKVGIALMDAKGDKRIKTRAVLLPLSLFSPFLFLPCVIIGLILDLTVFPSFTGLETLIGLTVGVLFFTLALIYMIINIKIEKNANSLTMEIMEKSNFLNEEERIKVKGLFDSFIAMYIIDLILSIFEVIYQLFRLFVKLFAKVTFKSKK